MFISSLPVPLDILIFRQRAMKAKKKSSGALPQVPASWRHFGSNLTQYTYIYTYLSIHSFLVKLCMYMCVCLLCPILGVRWARQVAAKWPDIYIYE